MAKAIPGIYPLSAGYFAPISAPLRPKLTVGDVNDPAERAADAMADRVMRMAEPDPAPSLVEGPLRRKCAACEEEDLRKAPVPGPVAPGGAEAPASVHAALRSPGRPLDAATRSVFEPRFGYDLGAVRLHTDAAAAASARAVGARAYTVGQDVVFGAGQLAPGSKDGQRLLAHELAHVVMEGHSVLRRDCADPTFCTPYPTTTEAAEAEVRLRLLYLPLEHAQFGAESGSLYDSFLSRSPGASLSPVRFTRPGSALVQSFRDSWAVDDDQDDVIDLVGDRLHLAPGGRPRPYAPTMMSLANFLTPAEMNNRPINFSNPFSIAGHIAGGIGSSDAGPDYRNITYGNVTLQNTPLFAGTGYITVDTTLQYEIFDTVDFCLGDCGSPAEQVVTIPMSRLEAGGQAYDVPFLVQFTSDTRSKRFFYS